MAERRLDIPEANPARNRRLLAGEKMFRGGGGKVEFRSGVEKWMTTRATRRPGATRGDAG